MFLHFQSTSPHCVHVGGPAYVHTCVLSGSRGTAGVLAFSLNAIFKPLCSSLENHHSVASQPAQRLLRHSSYLPAAVCWAVHLHPCECRIGTRIFALSLGKTRASQILPHLRPNVSKIWPLRVSDRHIKKINGSASWHLRLCIRCHFFWLISVSHHVRLSSVSEEMMPNESRQIKSELCVVIKAVTPAGSLPLEYYKHCKGKKKD